MDAGCHPVHRTHLHRRRRPLRIALFRANVLARWASALLAVGTLSAIGAGIVPQYERLFAIPTGLALVGLGYSLWRAQRTQAALPVVNPVSSNVDPVGVR